MNDKEQKNITEIGDKYVQLPIVIIETLSKARKIQKTLRANIRKMDAEIYSMI